MKSMDEVPKMKVADLKLELQSRGLDTKGIKAVLVDRLLDAMALEGGDEVGNGGNSLVKAHNLIEGEGGVEDEVSEDLQSPGQESPKRATRGHSPSKLPPSPTKALASPTLPAQTSTSPSHSTSPIKTVPLGQVSPIKQATTTEPVSSPVQTPAQVSPGKPIATQPITPTKSSTESLSATTGAVSPTKPVTSPAIQQTTSPAKPATSPAIQQTTSPVKPATSPGIQQTTSPVKSAATSPTKQTISPVKPAVAASPQKQPISPVKPLSSVTPAASSPNKPNITATPAKQPVSPTKSLATSPTKVLTEAPLSSQKDKSTDPQEEKISESDSSKTSNDEIDKSTEPESSQDNNETHDESEEMVAEEFPKVEGGDGDEQMETDDSESLKRKHEDGDGEQKIKEDKNENKPKKIRLEHYTMRILPEDEPEFDENEILLDWYKSDLNMTISKEGFLKATPNVFDEFPWAYAGVKSTHGFTSGKLAFEVKWLENLTVKLDFGKVEAKHVLRVGWSELHADLQLGEEELSYGYDSLGKFYNARDIQDLEEAIFQKGDVIASFLNLDSDPVEMKFTKNGTELPNSIQIPKENIEGKMFFPHILARNVSFEVNFGNSEPAFPMLDQFEMLTKVEATESNRIRGTKAPSSKADCEFVMLVGMACCGKTTWSKNHKKNNPDKHFNIIGTSSVVERAVKKTTLKGPNTPRVYDSFLMKAGRFVEKLVDLAPTRRRNYILDQSNVMPVVQRRKAAGFEGFKRRAVVILPNDEEYQNRIKAREQEQGKSVPKSTLLDMKATFRLPEIGDVFSEVDFPELSKEECEELLTKYNKEGADAGYHGQKSSRGWFSHPGGFRGRGQSGFRGGYRGPRRGGFRGGPPHRFRGDFRPPRGGGAARVPRDFPPRSFAPPRGRGGSPQPLIPRRSEPSRNAWAHGASPMNGRGGSPTPSRLFQNPSRGSYGGGGGRGYGGQQMGNQRPQQSIWTAGQPGGFYGRASGGFPQQPDPWVQQVPDQGYGQSWGDIGGTGRSGGGGAWQGYGHGGQGYGGYGRK